MRGFLTRLALITAAAALLMTLWSRLSAPPSSTAGPMPGPATVASLPRTVDARGDLAADEQSTIALFEATRDSVVFISTAQRVSAVEQIRILFFYISFHNLTQCRVPLSIAL